ncbi:MAG: hypothetical protein RJB66_1561 [Pseudomonadota bacterium]|jgi:hypothetical protein
MKQQNSKLKGFIATMITSMSLITFASQTAMAQDYTFRFSLNGEVWEHPVSAESWKEAYDKASDACFSHYTGWSGLGRVKVDEDTANALLNTCTNPR